MAYRTLTTLLHSEAQDTATLDAAIDLTRRLGAHLTVVLAGVNTVDPGLYYGGINTAMISSALNDADEATRNLSTALAKRMAAEDIPWDDASVVASTAGIGQALVERSRYSDLTVLPRPYGTGRSLIDVAVAEAALLDSAAPVLILPPDMDSVAPPKRVLLPWDEGAPALAAARAAIPFLAQAEEVVICVIDPSSYGPERSDPGGSLAMFLNRHGAKVRISVLPSVGERISDVILTEAKAQQADMIVMGGYGHSRTRQYILGGTTRRMLENSQVPLFMAH